MAQANRARPSQPDLGGIVFVHIPKTGGTSVVEALNERIWSTGHNSMLYVKEKWPERYDALAHSFSIIRNPWDRMVAYYLMSMWPSPVYLNRRPFVGPGQERKDRFQLWLNRGMPNQPGKSVKTAQSMLCDKQGRLLVKEVHEFKQLPRVIVDYCKILGITERVPHSNRRDYPARGAYQTYYTDLSREIVAEWGAWEIERFGYTF